MEKIQPSDWKWFGHAGHLCVSQWCRFHLCTLVGDLLVSTVGEYVPDEAVREIHCKFADIQLVGKGDARLADYMKKVGFQEIGYKRKYETMVFRINGKFCTSKECNCGMPEIISSELAANGYNQASDATAGHYELCEKAATGLIKYDEASA